MRLHILEHSKDPQVDYTNLVLNFGSLVQVHVGQNILTELLVGSVGAQLNDLHREREIKRGRTLFPFSQLPHLSIACP